MINLLPWREAWEWRRLKFNLLVAGAVYTIVLGFWLGLYGVNLNLAENNQNLEESIKHNQQQAQVLRQQQAKIQQQLKNTIQAKTLNSKQLVGLLERLMLVPFKQGYLNYLLLENGQVEVQGKINQRGEFYQVEQFFLEHGSFQKVKTQEFNSINQGEFSFRFEIKDKERKGSKENSLIKE